MVDIQSELAARRAELGAELAATFADRLSAMIAKQGRSGPDPETILREQDRNRLEQSLWKFKMELEGSATGEIHGEGPQGVGPVFKGGPVFRQMGKVR